METELDGAARTAQDFFSGLEAETHTPGYGSEGKALVQALLLRAQEAGLYRPPPPPKPVPGETLTSVLQQLAADPAMRAAFVAALRLHEESGT